MRDANTLPVQNGKLPPLEEFATNLVQIKPMMKVAFGGFAGAGKSFSSSRMAKALYEWFDLKKPILFIDNENGGRYLIPYFKEHGIECLTRRSVSVGDCLSAFDYLDQGMVDLVFIDSITKIWQNFIKDYQKKNNKTFMSLNDWGNVIPYWNETFNEKLVNCRGSVIFTGRGGYEYEKEEDEVDDRGNVKKKGQFVKSGVKMKVQGETSFEADLSIWMNRETTLVDGKPVAFRTGTVIKDRSDLLDGKIIKNPTPEDWKPVIDFLTALPTGDIIHGSTDDIAPVDGTYRGPNSARRKDAALEQIAGHFEKAGFGTKSEHKALKAAVSEKLFGTYSATEIKRLDVETLEHKRELADELIPSLTDKWNVDEFGSLADALIWIEAWTSDPSREIFGEEEPLPSGGQVTNITPEMAKEEIAYMDANPETPPGFPDDPIQPPTESTPAATQDAQDANEPEGITLYDWSKGTRKLKILDLINGMETSDELNKIQSEIVMRSDSIATEWVEEFEKKIASRRKKISKLQPS